MDRCYKLLTLLALITSVACGAWAQGAPSSASSEGSFAPFEQWKSAVFAGDVPALQGLYSISPPARIDTDAGSNDADSEAAFWIAFKARKISYAVSLEKSPRPEIHLLTFKAEVPPAAPGDHTRYITEGLVWQQQADSWRVVAAKRTGPAYLEQPANKYKNIYPANLDAHQEIKEAQEKAAKEHKRILLVFGANWCFDCHVLDLAFQRPDFAPVVARYVVVHVDIGEDGKKNGDVAKQYEVPLEKGVPALAVLDATGKLLVSQKNGEFQNARSMTPEPILEFLNKWKLEA